MNKLDEHQFGDSDAAKTLINILNESNDQYLTRIVGRVYSQTMYRLTRIATLLHDDPQSLVAMLILYRNDVMKRIDKSKHLQGEVNSYLKNTLNRYFAEHIRYCNAEIVRRNSFEAKMRNKAKEYQ